MANDLVRTLHQGEDITGQATAAITGKKFVRISAARTNKFNVLGATADGNNYKVAPVNAIGQPAIGVAKYDQPNVGGKVGIARGGIAPVLAGAAITAGQEVMADATGAAIPWVFAASDVNKKLGLAVDDAANATDAEILLYD